MCGACDDIQGMRCTRHMMCGACDVRGMQLGAAPVVCSGLQLVYKDMGLSERNRDEYMGLDIPLDVPGLSGCFDLRGYPPPWDGESNQ